MKRIIAAWPDEPLTKDTKIAAFIYAALLIVMVVSQLFSFEKFIPLLDSFNLPAPLSEYGLAVTLVICGVLALPFLLRMKVSSGMRFVSMIAGWVVALAWLFLGLWLNVSGVVPETAGLLGASVTLITGWWVVFVAIGFCVLAAWTAWGMWPLRRAQLETHRKK